MKLFRLINKNIYDMVMEETLATHRELHRSNNVREIVAFVKKYNLPADDLSVITTTPRSMTVYPYQEGAAKWMRG